MAKVLFVGNLPFSTNDESLRTTFEAVGEVVSANVIMDRATNRSKGYGFVEMTSEEAAEAAVKQLDGSDMDGRKLTVNVKREQAAA